MQRERTEGKIERRITGGSSAGAERHMWPDGMPASIRSRITRQSKRQAACECDCGACADGLCSFCEKSSTCAEPIDDGTTDQIIAGAHRRVAEHLENHFTELRILAAKYRADQQCRAFHARWMFAIAPTL